MSRPPYPTYPHHHPHHGRPYIEVHDHDILCGRGVNIASHPGNERFRALVQTRHDDNYCTAYTTSEKRAVAEQILKHIKSLDPPGRFLKRIGRAPTSRGLQGPWEELTDREAIKKTCQALRDCNRTDRSGYAAAVAVPEDVRRHAESRSMSGLSNKEQAAAAAATKVRAEDGPGVGVGVPMHPQQPTHPGVNTLRIALAPGPVPMPYHSGMPVVVPVPIPIAMPPPRMAGAPMPVRPDLSTTSSHVYHAPVPMHHHHHHHPGLPPPPHPGHAMHHPHSHPVHHHLRHSAPLRQAPPVHSINRNCPPPQRPAAPPPKLAESSSTGLLETHVSQPSFVLHHHDRRHSHSSEASSKRSRSAFEDDERKSPSVADSAEWLKKAKSVDTRAPVPPVTTANTITPTDPVGPGFISDGVLTGYGIGAAPAGTPSQETTMTGTTPTSEGANSLSRVHRSPSLSPASAVPPSPTLAYNPHRGGPALYSHHDYISAPTPTTAEHPYEIHHYTNQADAPSSDPKHSDIEAAAAAAHLDQQQLQAAAEAAAAAVAAADSQHDSDFAAPSPVSFHHEDCLPLM